MSFAKIVRNSSRFYDSLESDIQAESIAGTKIA